MALLVQLNVKASRARFSIALSAALAASACSATVSGGLVPASALPSSVVHGASTEHLYVAGYKKILVYNLGGSLVRTIRYGGYDGCGVLKFDADGNLYVSDTIHNAVIVYAKGGDKVLRKITRGLNSPCGIVFDSSGNTYVSNRFGIVGTDQGSVTVYGPRSTALLRTIASGLDMPGAMTFDAVGNLYVLSCNAFCGIRVFAPGETSVSRTITKGVAGAVEIRFDRGDLYCTCNEITVYPRGKPSHMRTITQRVEDPYDLAFERGNVYVSNHSADTVTEYAHDSGALLQTIKSGLSSPSTLAFDKSGNLYVENDGANNVTVYAPGQSSVLRTMPGPAGPLPISGLAIGP